MFTELVELVEQVKMEKLFHLLPQIKKVILPKFNS